MSFTNFKNNFKNNKGLEYYVKCENCKLKEVCLRMDKILEIKTENGIVYTGTNVHYLEENGHQCNFGSKELYDSIKNINDLKDVDLKIIESFGDKDTLVYNEIKNKKPIKLKKIHLCSCGGESEVTDNKELKGYNINCSCGFKGLISYNNPNVIEVPVDYKLKHCSKENVLLHAVNMVNDLCYDYDGCNTVEELKRLVDEFREYTSYALKEYDNMCKEDSININMGDVINYYDRQNEELFNNFNNK